MTKLATSASSAASAASAPRRTQEPGIPSLRWHWDFGANLTPVETQRLLGLLISLLDTSALREAASRNGMSYRAAWGLLHRCEVELGLRFVTMQRGRGTTLTALGESFVELDTAARLALGEVHSAWEARMRDFLTPVLPDEPEARRVRLLVFASHDLALADWVEHGRQVPAEFRWSGSEIALTALARGECDAAGFHVPEVWDRAQLVAWLGRWLIPGLHLALPVMRRRQGLLVRRGNPLRISSLADIAHRGARMVNRQPGSATRRLIDQLLAANGISGADLDGYAHEEFTHEAVAAAIASGQADAGFAIEAAAVRFDLDFIPLLTERYGFAMRPTVASSPAGQSFIKRLKGATFRQRLHALGGYDALTIGEPLPWDDFLGKLSPSVASAPRS